MADGLADTINNIGPLSLQDWNAGIGPDGSRLSNGQFYTVMTSDGPQNLKFTGTGDTGGGGGSTNPMIDAGTDVPRPTPTTPPNPLSGPSSNGLPWYPNTYGLGPGMHASLQDQIAAQQARQYRNPFDQSFERFSFSRGTPADQTTWKGWGKAAPNENYPLPNPTPPVPVTPPTQPQQPTPPGPVVAPPAGTLDPNRGPVGVVPSLRGDQVPVGQMPAMRRSPNGQGGLLGTGTPAAPVAPSEAVRGALSETAMRQRPGAGLLGAQMIGSQADATVADGGRGLLGNKALAAPAATQAAAGTAPWITNGMAPSAGGAADAFRFSGGTPAETNYNALAAISPALAGKYYAAAAGANPGLSTAALNQTGGGEAYRGLQNFYGSGGGMGYSGGRVVQAGGDDYLKATLANLSPQQRAAAEASAKSFGYMPDVSQFQTMLTPQQAAAWGLLAAKLPAGMNPAGTGGLGLYTVGLPK